MYVCCFIGPKLNIKVRKVAAVYCLTFPELMVSDPAKACFRRADTCFALDPSCCSYQEFDLSAKKTDRIRRYTPGVCLESWREYVDIRLDKAFYYYDYYISSIIIIAIVIISKA